MKGTTYNSALKKIRKNLYWTTMSGDEILISDMDKSHLQNTIILLSKKQELCTQYGLGDFEINDLTANEIKTQLRETILGDPNQYRIDRIAKTEVNLSEGKASVSAIQNIQNETGYKIYKIWNTSGGDPCEFCQSLNGNEVLVDANFVDLHADIHGVDGGVYKNDFTATDTADAHPNCNCYATYKVEA